MKPPPLEHQHTPAAIRARLSAGPRHSYLRDAVYGGIDGAVTTFAIVAGVVGAHLAPEVILILGAANLLGDGFSMAASNYSGTRTEHQELEAIRAREGRHIDVDPEGEREEVRQLLEAKGLSGEPLRQMEDVVTADRERWIEFMLVEEYGLPLTIRPALAAALATFAAFAICGAVPLLPFILVPSRALQVSLSLTAVVFFAIGSSKSLWLSIPWWKSGLETLAIGSAAAALAFITGRFIASL